MGSSDSEVQASAPGIAPERAKVLRDALMQTAKDPDFLSEAKKLELEIRPIDHNEIERLLREAAAAPPEVIAQFQSLMTATK
jgi:hypothetical protein